LGHHQLGRAQVSRKQPSIVTGLGKPHFVQLGRLGAPPPALEGFGEPRHWRKSMPFYRCQTDLCRIVQDLLIGIFILAAIGGVISLGSSGLQLFSSL